MKTATTPTSSEIRRLLVKRAEAYCRRTGSSFSAIGLAAVNDSKFLARVRDGRGFNVETYQRVVDWLSKAEASALEAAE